MKSKTAADEVQELVTLADVQAAQVVVVQTLIVAAVHVSHLSHLSHCSHLRVVLASVKVTVFQSVSPNTISFQLKAAEFILAHVAHVSHWGQVSHWGHSSPCGHCTPCIPWGHLSSVLASSRITLSPSESVNTILSQLNTALSILAHSGHCSPWIPCSPCSHWGHWIHWIPWGHWGHWIPCIPWSHLSPFSHFRFLYWAFLILFQSSLSENRI